MYKLVASLMFFTRLPFWRFVKVPGEHFKDVVSYWPIVGLVTSSVMAGTLWVTYQIAPAPVAVICAIISRILLTGALHEDGLADFFDGFGGGKSREQILSIMKDSHIGSYGVISLILYFITLSALLNSLPVNVACCAILAGDPINKYIASFITLRLTYARKEEESKSKIIYRRSGVAPIIMGLIISISLLTICLEPRFYMAVATPVLLFFILTQRMKRKIGGYTGDCCGALFLLCELAFYCAVVIINNYHGTLFGQAYLS